MGRRGAGSIPATSRRAGGRRCRGLTGAPAGGHGEHIPGSRFRRPICRCGRRNRPCVAGIGIVPAEGTPLTPAACRVRAAYSLSSEAPIPLPGNDPAMVRATVPRSGACRRGSVYAPGDTAEPRPGHPLHPMIAGHATGQKQGRDYRIAVLIATVFELVIQALPAGRRKPFSRPRPRRPKGPGLILSVARQDLAEAARLLCNFLLVDRCPDRRPGLPRLRF